MQIPELNLLNCELWQARITSLRTPMRFVMTYELEYHYETDGCSVVNGEKRDLYPGMILLGKPGDLRYSTPPKGEEFRTQVIRFEMVNDPHGSLFRLLSQIPTFTATDPAFDALWKQFHEEYAKKDNYHAALRAQFALISMLLHLSERGQGEEGYTPPSSHQQSLYRAIRYMRKHLGEELSVSDVASYIGYSTSHFNHLFKEYTKSTPYAYFLTLKMNEAKRLLLDTDMSISEISERLSFGSISKFGAAFKADCGETPGKFRKRYCGVKN